MSNNPYKTGSERNTALVMGFVPKEVESHDLLSARLRSVVVFQGAPFQAILIHLDLLAPNISNSFQAVVHFIISTPP